MIQDWLTRYHPRYPRTIVYMLQASEYGIRDYLRWYHRTKDFTAVERRKHFVKTPKALLLLGIAWGIVLFLAAAAVLVIWFGTVPLRYVVFFCIALVAPSVLAYGILIPLLAITVCIERPLTYWILRAARRRLEMHKAVRIAVAGSFGKTTMREILKTVLSEGKKVGTPPQNYNTPLGLSAFIRTLNGDEDVLVFELGEYYPGDIQKLCHLVRPDIGIITGINEAHLERFNTLERTAATVYELADYLGDKPIYVNGENESARTHARLSHILYSRQGVGNWNIEDQKTDLAGTSFVLVKKDMRLELRSSLLGLHQVGPLAAAVDIAFNLGLSPSQIKDSVWKTKPFEHRLEPRAESAGVITLDDSYNGNPDGVAVVIEFLASLQGRRRWYVTPGLVEMGTRREAVHRQIGRQLAKAGIEKVVLIRNSVTGYIEQGLQEAGFRGDVVWFEDALAAYAALPHLTARGDLVLLQNDLPDQYQ